ncbi:hypothetical protein BC830DRAFT_15763 [Chytriomyces sp. MP71]|nr:hypothetical protein BC830DRAFT_15763 [Chytriomyces sp. MP71]
MCSPKNGIKQMAEVKPPYDPFHDPDSSLKPTDQIYRAKKYDPTLAAKLNTKTVVESVVRVKARDCRSATGVASLKNMCARVVGNLIEHVESLAGLPANLAMLVHANVKTMSPETITMFMTDFPEEFGAFNAHLVFRDATISRILKDNLCDAWLGPFLRVMDLGGTDFGDELCIAVSRLEMLELLDLSGTKITSSGVRNLCRIMIHSDRNSKTGMPNHGLKNLAFLNLSLCSRIDGRDLDVLLARFPSLLAVGLNRTSAKQHGAVHRMMKNDWEVMPNEINVFPGWREPTYKSFDSSAFEGCLSLSSAKVNDLNSIPAQPNTINSMNFFGNSRSRANSSNSKLTEAYFQYRAYQLDDHFTHKALAQLNPAYRSIVKMSRALISKSANSGGQDLPHQNDIYRVLVGERPPSQVHVGLRPWYLPFKPPANLHDREETGRIVKEIVEAEVASRIQLVRTRATRDADLKNSMMAMEEMNSGVRTSKGVAGNTDTALVNISKTCAKRMEPAPKIIPMGGGGKRLKLDASDFGDMLNVFQKPPTFSGGGIAPTVSKPSASSSSGLFKLLSKK